MILDFWIYFSSFWMFPTISFEQTSTYALTTK